MKRLVWGDNKMRILVTGGAAFAGSCAGKHFAKKGCEVVIVGGLNEK